MFKDFKPGTRKWAKFMAKLYGLGAAIVIVGAMFKINHFPGATVWLVIGLSTEAIIFFFSAFEPVHEEIDWSLVYPELKGMHGEEGHEEGQEQLEETVEPASVTEQLDHLLEEAKIGPELIQSLGEGLKSIGDQASKLNDITDASVATEEYANAMKGASKSAETLSSSYSKASSSIEASADALSSSYVKAADALDMLSAGQNAEIYGEQMEKVSKNLSALNASYELQLQSTKEHLSNTNKLFEGVEDTISSLKESTDNARKFKEEMATLSENLTALNNVYGNILTAMNMGRK
jgi:gliding motility-associated protein GldL